RGRALCFVVQAEDGIGAELVTGVQTCALPIFTAMCARALGAARCIVVGGGKRLDRAKELGFDTVDYHDADPVARVRDLTAGLGEIGRAPCRERGETSVEDAVRERTTATRQSAV